MDSFLIPVPAEFNFDLCLAFLNRSPHELLHVCAEHDVVKLLRVNDTPVLFRLRANDIANLEVVVMNTSVTEVIKQELQQYIHEWFDLDTDLKPFYALVQEDDVLKTIVRQFYGYRIIGPPDLFESLVWAVLGQQVNLQFAYTLKHRLIEGFGDKIVFEEKPYYIFPSAATVATLTDHHLLPLQFSRQKSKYITGIAEAFASGEVSKEKIKNLPFQEAKEALTKINGIGNWTANYVLMKTFHHPEAFPLEDAGLHNAIRNQLKLLRKPTLEEVKMVFKKYKGWEAYATLYLWRSL